MFVVRSNRAERLVDHLAEVLREPLSDPFCAEQVAVQSRGMERWLTHELASRLGVWAHAEHPFPRRLVIDVVAAALELDATVDHFERSALVWTLSQMLPEVAVEPGYEEVGSYLSEDPHGLKRHQLAAQLADLFDQYVVYRPEMVLGWESGASPTDWQASLWRRLVAKQGGDHIARRVHSALSRRHWPVSRLPERVSLFGIATLPPMYLHVLGALGKQVPVYLYMLAPTSLFIGDLESKSQSRKRRRAQKTPQDLHLEEGNPLLASFGRLGRDLQGLVADLDAQEREDFVAPPSPTNCSTLQLLQADMFHVVSRKPDTGSRQATLFEVPHTLPSPLPLTDLDSLRLHRCHSAMREVEVLRDELRRLLDADSSLQPRDIVVMTPDIEQYAPLIRAVFGIDSADPDHIPYAISDRPLRSDSVVVEGFMAALGLLDSRFTASEVLDLLACAPVARRFSLSDEDRAGVERDVRESGIRWGVDAVHRKQVGQPEHPQNTWRFGLDRMLAGLASGEAGPVCGDVPYDEIEGDSSLRVGRLADAVTLLVHHREQAARPRPPAAWSDLLVGLLDGLFLPDDNELWGAQRLRRELVGLADQSADHTGEVGLDVIRWWLEQRVSGERAGHRYLQGGITVCALLPMRSIPFRVVALLGMGVEAFPRLDRRPAFDRLSAAPQPGDRSLREEDRTLFLEALLSARDHLHISWVGRSIRDNAELPPSVVVSEVLDWLNDAFLAAQPRIGDGEVSASSDPLIVDHPLQPFHPEYFGAGAMARGRVSTSRPYARGAIASLSKREMPPPFLVSAFRSSEESPDHVSLDALIRFLQNPAKGTLEALGIRSTHEQPLLRDREPLVPDALDRYQLAESLLDRTVDNGDLDGLWAALQGAGQLPAGVVGRCVFEELRPSVHDVASALRELQTGDPLPPCPVDLEVGGARVDGWVNRLWSGGQVLRQYSRIHAKHQIAAWVRHLAFCGSGVDGPAPRTWLVGRHSKGARRRVLCFEPVDDALEHLALLVRVWRMGQGQLVAFDPEMSMAYSRLAQRHKADAWGLGQLDRDFEQRMRLEPTLALAYRGHPGPRHIRVDDPSMGFEKLAIAVLGPMLAARREP